MSTENRTASFLSLILTALLGVVFPTGAHALDAESDVLGVFQSGPQSWVVFHLDAESDVLGLKIVPGSGPGDPGWIGWDTPWTGAVWLPLEAELDDEIIELAQEQAPREAWCVLDAFIVQPLPPLADELLHAACYE